MLRNCPDVLIEQLAHLCLGQPDRILVQPNIQTDLNVRSFVEYDLSTPLIKPHLMATRSFSLERRYCRPLRLATRFSIFSTTKKSLAVSQFRAPSGLTAPAAQCPTISFLETVARCTLPKTVVASFATGAARSATNASGAISGPCLTA